MVEIRHIQNGADTVEGAATSTPGEFVLHGVGAAPNPDSSARVATALESLVDAAAPVDTGKVLGSWTEGAAAVPTALHPDIRARIAGIADTLDPHRTIARSRLIG